MATNPSIPDYKRDLIHNLEELKREFKWCLDHPQKVTQEKMKDFKRGVRNLRSNIQEKIKDEKFIRDIERFDVLINGLTNYISDIDKAKIELIFERIETLINDLG